jgi:hypothetical protein
MKRTGIIILNAIKPMYLPAIFLLFIYFNSNTKAIAQTEWAPIGAKWTYQIFDMWTYIFKFETFTSAKDTIVSNKTCKKIEINTLIIDSAKHTKTTLMSYKLMYGENGKVYYSYKDTFLLLYDFSLKADDTLIIPKLYSTGPKDSLKTKYLIVSVSNINITGKILKKQHIVLIPDSVNGNDANLYFGNHSYADLIEGLGSDNYMFGQQHGLEELFSFLKCYEDSNLIYKRFPTSDCDNFNALNYITKSDKLDIYPNPTNDKITIDCVIRQDYTMHVYNTVGQCLMQRELNTQTNTIDISSLTSGIYILKLTSSNGTIEKKIIKK